MNGIIYKAIGGFYYVKTANGIIIECKPRGIFRKQRIRLVAGDRVELAQEAGTWYIDKLKSRKNVFVRPPIANVDVFFVVISTVQPDPNYFVIDKLTAVAIDSEVQPVLIFTKTDLQPETSLQQVYAQSGIPMLAIREESGLGMEEILGMLEGKLGVFCGNSGVGKSTLLNHILPQAERETAQISQKLGRGRHTTREVELYDVGQGIIADTPGFSSFEVGRVSPILKENLQFCFPEINERMLQCRFTGCTHMAEAGCAVRDAVQKEEISAPRYESYCALYREAEQAEKY